MTGLAAFLEDFGAARAGGRPSVAVPDEGALEAAKLEGFDGGYRAGWDDAIKAQSDDQSRNPYFGSTMLKCADRVELIAGESRAGNKSIAEDPGARAEEKQLCFDSRNSTSGIGQANSLAAFTAQLVNSQAMSDSD